MSLPPISYRALPALLALSALLGAPACGGGGGGGGGTRAGGGANGGATGGAGVLAIEAPGDHVVSEEATLTVPIVVRADPHVADPVRVFVTDLPPGARFDAAARTVTFRPDFIQGGARWTPEVLVRQGALATTARFSIEVLDTVAPPAPTVAATADGGDHLRLTLSQRTDAFLDSTGRAGRAFEARVVVPKAASALDRRAVRVYLHGFGGTPHTGGQGREFAIYPHDPENTYWWGYAERLPGAQATQGGVPPYTLRRVLRLVEWVLATYPGADPERVYAVGGSMGGAGAVNLGLLFARHFAYVEGTIGQTIAKNHRPSRVTQLTGLWGAPSLALADAEAGRESGLSAWDRQDATRALRDEAEARDQFVFTKHGKDDDTIHFGAVTHLSPATGASFYEALQAFRVGHTVVWDEGAHGPADPVLGAGWWDGGLERVHDAVTFLRRDRPFPAFTRSSLDDDPGDGAGNGRRAWNAERGYAGVLGTAGDTGWTGAIAGARNRHLRWDARAIAESTDRLEMPLCVKSGGGSPAPRAGYPTIGDRVGGTLPATVDVTIRRTHAFRPAPGEAVRWTYGAQSGTAQADQDGAVTVERLAIDTAWTTLVLER